MTEFLPLLVLFLVFLFALLLRTAARALPGGRLLLLTRSLLTALLSTLLAALAFRALGARGRRSVGPLAGRR